MFDIGWTELLLIGLVALIVVGPKDLPGMFKALGQFTAKAKRMAREFTSAMEAAADDAGVNEVQKTLRDVANPNKMGMDALKKAADFDVKPKGPATTPALSPEREAAKQKILENSAKIANERLAKEAAEAAPEAAPTPASKPAVKKTAAKKPAAKKSAATPAAAKKPAAKKPAAKKPAVKKAAAKPKTAGKTPKADT